MKKSRTKELLKSSEIKNEKQTLNIYNVEVISPNLKIGSEIYQKGTRLKVSNLDGLRHFIKVI